MLFLKSRDPQATSPLFTLSAELRIKIFRLLCKSRDVIGDVGHSSITSYGRRTSFSAQVLSCCQQMYDEARPVLYSENVLLINSRVSFSLSSTMVITSLNLEINAFTRYDDADWIHNDVFTKTPVQLFDRYNVIIYFKKLSDVWSTVRALELVLWGKTVKMSLVGVEGATMRGCSKACRRLFCREIRFDTGFDNKEDPQVLNATQNIVETLNKADNEDVLSRWTILYRDVICALPRMKEDGDLGFFDSFELNHKWEVENAVTAMYLCDVSAFKSARQKVIEKIPEWVSAWKDYTQDLASAKEYKGRQLLKEAQKTRSTIDREVGEAIALYEEVAEKCDSEEEDVAHDNQDNNDNNDNDGDEVGEDTETDASAEA